MIQLYEPPVPPQKLMEALQWMDDDMLNMVGYKLIRINQINSRSLPVCLERGQTRTL